MHTMTSKMAVHVQTTGINFCDWNCAQNKCFLRRSYWAQGKPPRPDPGAACRVCAGATVAAGVGGHELKIIRYREEKRVEKITS